VFEAEKERQIALELQKQHEEEKARLAREAQEKEEQHAEALQSEKQKQLETAIQVNKTVIRSFPCVLLKDKRGCWFLESARSMVAWRSIKNILRKACKDYLAQQGSRVRCGQVFRQLFSQIGPPYFAVSHW
jgi:hypothetical protein